MLSRETSNGGGGGQLTAVVVVVVDAPLVSSSSSTLLREKQTGSRPTPDRRRHAPETRPPEAVDTAATAGGATIVVAPCDTSSCGTAVYPLPDDVIENFRLDDDRRSCRAPTRTGRTEFYTVKERRSRRSSYLSSVHSM